MDATAATPLLSRPLELGADVVVHSATKAINGHSDVLAGLLVCNNAFVKLRVTYEAGDKEAESGLQELLTVLGTAIENAKKK